MAVSRAVSQFAWVIIASPLLVAHAFCIVQLVGLHSLNSCSVHVLSEFPDRSSCQSDQDARVIDRRRSTEVLYVIPLLNTTVALCENLGIQGRACHNGPKKRGSSSASGRHLRGAKLTFPRPIGAVCSGSSFTHRSSDCLRRLKNSADTTLGLKMSGMGLRVNLGPS